MHHGVTFNFDSAKVCSPAIFETSLSYDKDICVHLPYLRHLYLMTKIDGLLQLLHNCAFSIDSYSPVNIFYGFIIFSLLINAVILLLNCLVLILYYPTALKDCQGIVFNHGVRMIQLSGGRSGGGKKFILAVSQKP